MPSQIEGNYDRAEYKDSSKASDELQHKRIMPVRLGLAAFLLWQSERLPYNC